MKYFISYLNVMTINRHQRTRKHANVC